MLNRVLQCGWSNENKTNVLIHGITDGIYKQDYLPIILIQSINTVIKNIHCTVCTTYLLDNLMYIFEYLFCL